MAARACRADMAFVRVYGRATPDRAGARPYQWGPDLIPYVDADGRPPDRNYELMLPMARQDKRLETTEICKTIEFSFLQ
jgi:hypothetical protein